MKKFLLTILAILLPIVASADAVVIDGIYYNLISISKGKFAEVTSNPNNYSGNVDIPEEVKHEGTEYSVTSIGNSAFYGCYGLTSVTIPNSVTSIGNYAFSQCSSLTSITIPNSVTSIGYSAFSGCSSLTSVTIPNSVTSIGNDAFFFCSGLTSVTIPNSVTSIGNYAFSLCSGLTSVTIPNSVTSIGNHAFDSCYGLTSITIPNSVTSIGEEAFAGCSGLISVTIPNSVTSIGECAFYGCSSLTSITIPNSVTSIGKGSFHNCSSLTTVIIGNSVTSIGNYMFQNCSSLISITIPNSVTSIGNSAFAGCSGLISITIPNSVTSIEEDAFSRCSDLTSVTIGSGIKTIRSWAFALCPELTDVYCLAEVMPSTEANAFQDSYTEYATLHVPTASIDKYKSTEPWSSFKTIVGLDGTTPEEPVTPKCEKPTISYQNGKLSFTCVTEGVDFISEITDTDIKNYYTKEVDLTVTYLVSVYAIKSGYDNSDVATATLCWIDVDPKTEGITGVTANVRAMPVMIQSNGNVLTISEAPEGEEITVYNLSGQKVGSAKAVSERTDIITSLQTGEVGIVKIGSKTVTVMIK